MKSIQRELMELILANREALSLPESLQADFLPTEGDALSFQSDNVPKLAKSYISGTSEYNYAFSILAVLWATSSTACTTSTFQTHGQSSLGKRAPLQSLQGRRTTGSFTPYK